MIYLRVGALALSWQQMSTDGQTAARRPAARALAVVPNSQFLHDDDPAVVALALDFPQGAINPTHTHPRGQLVYTARGVTTTDRCSGSSGNAAR
jgi:quercetin dioxygenase-like cupin family protein